MSERNIEIRAILRHYWKRNFKETEAAKKICEVEVELLKLKTPNFGFDGSSMGTHQLKELTPMWSTSLCECPERSD